MQSQSKALKLHCAETEKERDGLAVRIVRMGTTQEPHTSTVTGIAPTVEPRKSAKIADPPLLDNGTNPRFEDWMILMKNKLRANADHYPTTEIQLALVAGRCTGAAFKHIAPRIRDSATT